MILRRLVALLSLIVVLSAPALAGGLNPESDPAYQQAIAAYAQKDWARAVTLFTEALAHYPSLAAYGNRGNAYNALGDYDRALADYDQALLLNNDELVSRRVVLSYCRASLYLRLKEYEKAEDDLNYVMTRTSPTTPLYMARGSCRLHLGKLADARRDFAAALKRKPDNIEADLALLKLDRRTAGVAATRAHLTHIIASVDRSPTVSACNNIAWFLATVDDSGLRDGHRALAYATKACELTEWKDAGCIDTFAAASAETGDFPNAVKWEEAYLSAEKLTPAEKQAANARLEMYRRDQPYRAAD